MATYIQADRPLTISTPLGQDALLLVGFTGHEALSRLFRFQLDLMAENATPVPFENLLGQRITIHLGRPGEKVRHLSGICSRVSQGARDQTFTAYQMEVVPQLWLLTRKAQSRIFQQVSVPEILRQVLQGLDVSFEIQGTFHPRDYCVQYRETDFNFASRLMEEEGISYYFKHSANGHVMVVANAQNYPALTEPSTILYEEAHSRDARAGGHEEGGIHSWDRVQELRSGKYTLRDHCFELPHQRLEAQKLIQDSVAAGTINQKQKVAPNAMLELYDFPGEYAQRFDGVDPGGGDRPADIQKIFEDNQRTAAIRMQQEALPGLVIRGTGDCRHLVVGSRFALARHFNADGAYLLTQVQHTASMTSNYRSGDFEEMVYRNQFECIPVGLPFRPARLTPKPFVQGSQTAVVVGPPGQEIFTDKYGRIKVQFHWDRLDRKDASSSCWIRVGQLWAGKRWGASFWPRIGQEVIVDFIEGDPDQPIVVGSVYNADQMPPYLGNGPDSKLPTDNKVSGIKSNTTPGGVGFNEIRFDDSKDKQQVFLHAERNMDTRVKNDSMELVLHDRHLIVGTKDVGNQHEWIHKDKHLKVGGNHSESIGGSMGLAVGGAQDVSVGGDRRESIKGDNHLHVSGDRAQKVDGSTSLTVGASQQEKVGQKHALQAGQEIHLVAGMKVIIEAGAQITLKGPGGFVDIGPAGVTIQGTMVKINSGGAPGSGSGSSPTPAKDAKPAKPVEPAVADDAVTGQKSAP